MKKMSILLLAAATVLMAVSPAFAHDVAVTAPGLNGTNFKLEMQYSASDPAQAYVLSDHPAEETIYRASFVFHLTEANALLMPDPSFIYIFQTFANGFFSGPPSWGIRLGIHRVNGNTNLRAFARDNQTNRRATGNCLVPEDTDVTVEINWAAEQGGTTNFRLDTFIGGSPTPDCSNTVIGGLTNGFVRITDQLFITTPDAAAVLPNDFTVYVDEFASFRTLSAP